MRSPRASYRPSVSYHSCFLYFFFIVITSGCVGGAVGVPVVVAARQLRPAGSTFDPAARNAASVAPDLLLDGPSPVLFDEWQVVPTLWDQVRRAVDERAPTKGLYILTGSATPSEDVNRNSGAGRIATIQMRPMSRMESGRSTGEAALNAILADDKVAVRDSGMTVPDIIDRICIGGWPALLDASTQDASTWLRDYLNQIVVVDIQGLGVRRRDPGNIRRLVNSLTRNVGTSAKVTALAKDVGGAEGPVARATVYGYLDSLSRLRLTENSPAWAPRMRSATPCNPHRPATSSTPLSQSQHSARDPLRCWETSMPPASSSRTSWYAMSASTRRSSAGRSTTGETKTTTRSTLSSLCPTGDGERSR